MEESTITKIIIETWERALSNFISFCSIEQLPSLRKAKNLINDRIEELSNVIPPVSDNQMSFEMDVTESIKTKS